MSTHPLIDHLIAVHAKDDRATLALLRRGASPRARAAVYRVVVPFFPAESKPHIERALVQTAILFAMHPGAQGLSMGAALARLRDESESVELRFIALLDSHPDDLPTHLRHAVSLTRAHDIPIDWNNILDALLYWNLPSRRMQRRWARDFWTTHAVAKVTP